MEMGVEAAKSAWARLAGLDRLEGMQVIVDGRSPLGPAGWVAILAVGDTVTVAVPVGDLRTSIVAAIEGLRVDEATDPDVVVPRLPPAASVLGPAALFYPPSGFVAEAAGHDGAGGEVGEIDRATLEPLIDRASAGDLDESGIGEVAGPIFGSWNDAGVLVAACGYRRWPNDVAHLSVLTDAGCRGQGHGRRAAERAIRRAIDEDLLPQWRARPPASQALALRLGLRPMGAQLSVQLA